MGRPTIKLDLSEQERESLESWVRARKSLAADKLRAQIILACSKGEAGAQVGARLSVSEQTISKLRRRFIAYRLAGLCDAPRSGQPRKIGDEFIEEVIRKTLHEVPEHAHASTEVHCRDEVGVGDT